MYLTSEHQTKVSNKGSPPGWWRLRNLSPAAPLRAAREPAAPISARGYYESQRAAGGLRKVRLHALSVVRSAASASTAPRSSPPPPTPLGPRHLLWAPLPSPSPNRRAKDPDATARRRQAAKAQAQYWQAGAGACWPRLSARASQSNGAGGRCVRFERGRARSPRLAGGAAGSLRRGRRLPEAEVEVLAWGDGGAAGVALRRERLPSPGAIPCAARMSAGKVKPG